jgi:hypothetical protein
MLAWELARARLLLDHHKLRSMASSVMTLAKAGALGAVIPEFEHRLAALRDELLRHTGNEISALRELAAPFFGTGVAEQQARQHERILEAVDLASGHGEAARERSGYLLAAMDELIAHMDAEEETFLKDPSGKVE